jgi:hypothetical protein
MCCRGRTKRMTLDRRRSGGGTCMPVRRAGDRLDRAQHARRGQQDCGYRRRSDHRGQWLDYGGASTSRMGMCRLRSRTRTTWHGSCGCMSRRGRGRTTQHFGHGRRRVTSSTPCRRDLTTRYAGVGRADTADATADGNLSWLSPTALAAATCMGADGQQWDGPGGELPWDEGCTAAGHSHGQHRAGAHYGRRGMCCIGTANETALTLGDRRCSGGRDVYASPAAHVTGDWTRATTPLGCV